MCIKFILWHDLHHCDIIIYLLPNTACNISTKFNVHLTEHDLNTWQRAIYVECFFFRFLHYFFESFSKKFKNKFASHDVDPFLMPKPRIFSEVDFVFTLLQFQTRHGFFSVRCFMLILFATFSFDKCREHVVSKAKAKCIEKKLFLCQVFSKISH